MTCPPSPESPSVANDDHQSRRPETGRVTEAATAGASTTGRRRLSLGAICTAAGLARPAFAGPGAAIPTMAEKLHADQSRLGTFLLIARAARLENRGSGRLPVLLASFVSRGRPCGPRLPLRRLQAAVARRRPAGDRKRT